MSIAPSRAFRLTLRLDADTRDELARELERIALRIDREELTVGMSGGVSSGYTYELLADPSKTHEQYFEEVRQYLASERSA